MKAEHKEFIDRAYLHGVSPMVLAHELMVHDMVEAQLFELRNTKMPFPSLCPEDQQEVIDRMTKRASELARSAVGIIGSRGAATIEVTMKEVKFDSKKLTLTGIVDAKDPNRHELIDSAGRLCLLVMAPDDYYEGTDFVKPERNQRELPLSVSEIIAGTGLTARLVEPDEEFPEGTDPLYAEALAFVRDTRRPAISAVQRHLKVGYNRAARLLEQMEADGHITPLNSTGAREVIAQQQEQPPAQDDSDVVDNERPEKSASAPLGKEFGEFTYEDAANIVSLHGQIIDVAWLQRRLSIDSDSASSLLLRLLDSNIIKLESEADDRLDYKYRVIATLADVAGLELE
ncbi:DNA translocase FtsK [Pseudomonas guariconensis]|nr:DNA translocase FtsK [Pseudomonas guariconensis]